MDSSSPQAGTDSTLRVLTLNIWGLWLVSKRRAERVRHLANYLQSCSEDIVLLQEVWVDADAQQLISAGKAAGLAHATHFRSGMFGAGLVTLSRYPIVRHAFWRYAASGFASAVSCGDFYAGKGVGWVRLATPLGDVDVFNTHLHANYCHDYRMPPAALRRAAAAATAKIESGADVKEASRAAATALSEGTGVLDWAGSRLPDDDDAGTRISQLLELTEIIDLVSSSGSGSSSSSGSSCGGSSPGSSSSSSPESSSSSRRFVILGGDLNCKPDTLEVDLLRMRLPQLSDAWAAAAERSTGNSTGSCSNSSGGDGDSSTSSSLLESNNSEGFTCHAPGNTFQPRRQVPERIDYVWSNMVTQRVDIALQLCPEDGAAASDGSSSSREQPKKKKKKKASLSYSDHFAVRAVLAKSGTSTDSGGSKPSGPMKLGGQSDKQPAAAAAVAGAAATAAQQQQKGVAVTGEGAAMPLAKKVATAFGALKLLDEGFEAFSANCGVMTAAGGGLLATTVYVAVGLPLLWPHLALRGFALTAIVLVAAALGVIGLAVLLMGQVGDKAQRRALQSAYRLLRVWMQQQGLAALPQQWQKYQQS